MSRDKIDSERVEDPLTKAEDAHVLDNTYLDQKEQLAKVLKMAIELIG